MALCENCNKPTTYLPEGYDRETTSGKLFYLKKALQILRDEHKMFRESTPTDIPSMLATEQEIGAVEAEIRNLNATYEKEEEELDSVLLEKHLIDKEAAHAAAEKELVELHNIRKQIDDGIMSADDDDRIALDARTLNCKLRIKQTAGDIARLEEQMEID